MIEAKRQYKVIYLLIENFILQIGGHLKTGDTMDQITSRLKKIKVEVNTFAELFESSMLLSEVFEIICITINNEKETAESVSATPIIEQINTGRLLIELDLLAYYIYDAAKNSKESHEFIKQVHDTKNDKDFKNIFSDDIFGRVNGMFLDFDDELLTQIPKNAQVVEFSVDNTVNSVGDARNILDRDFILKNYSELTVRSGLCLDLINRFNVDTEYTGSKHQPITVGGGDIYQYLGEKEGKKYWRRLRDFSEDDIARHYAFLSNTMYLANMENKRLGMLRNIDKKIKGKIMTADKVGKIQGEYRKGKTLGGAVIDSIYNHDLTNEQMLRLLGYSLEFDANGRSASEDPMFFKKYKNFRAMENI